MKRFVWLLLGLVMIASPAVATKITWSMADTLQYPAGRRVIHAWVRADTLQSFLMVAGQRATTKYVASDTLRTDLITGLTDTNTGLSWLGADSIAVVAGGTARIVVGAGGNVYVPHRNLIVGRSTIENWSSSFEVLQLGKNALVGTDAQLQLFQGAYQSAGGFNYTTTNAPSRYGQLLGTHTWYSAPSGSVGGGITWNTLMTLSPGGRLAVGSTDTTLAKSLFYDNTALSIPVGYFYQDNVNATVGPLSVRHDGTGYAARLENTTDSVPLLVMATTPASGTGKVSNMLGGGLEGVADNGTATLFDAAQLYGILFIQLNTGSGSATAIIRAVTGPTPQAAIISQAGDYTVEVTTADVTGTTGTDGNLVISIRTATIEIENRTSVAADIGYQFFCIP